MTGKIFTEWLNKINQQMKYQTEPTKKTPNISKLEAMKCIESLKLYFLQKKDNKTKALEFLDALEDEIDNPLATVQTKILNFFKK